MLVSPRTCERYLDLYPLRGKIDLSLSRSGFNMVYIGLGEAREAFHRVVIGDLPSERETFDASKSLD